VDFRQTPEFKKDLKTLKKRWRSLENDIEIAKKVIVPLYVQTNPRDVISVENYREKFFARKGNTVLKVIDGGEIVKIRIDCASLGNKNAVRLVFVYRKIGSAIDLLELYSKTDKGREDRGRLKKYLS
jgi:hypothetical protein